jgi:serine/threonine protein phosphatase PrpC
MKISAYGHSDVGFLRDTNEDSFLVQEEKGIFAVADGVGGLPFGSLASLLAVQNFDALIHDHLDCGNPDELSKRVHRLHQNILKCGSIVGGQNGIGTTFSGIRFFEGKFIYGHVGDSYIMVYDHESDQLNQISRVHTLAAELIAKHGPDAAKEMPDHYNHTLTRCLGQDIDFSVDVGEFGVSSGNKIVLSSDGLTNMVSFEEISTLCANLDAKSLVHELIDQANQNGGIDNTTVVCLQID